MDGSALSAHVALPSRSGPKRQATRNDLADLLARRAIHGMLFTAVWSVQGWLPLFTSVPHSLLAEALVRTTAWNGIYWIIGFCLIALVQARIAPGMWRAVALLAATAGWSCVLAVLTYWGPSEALVSVQIGLVSPGAAALDRIWRTTYLFIAAWYYESAERAARAAAALAKGELARRSAERWLLELRLGALQARLDPQLLFDALDEVQRLYRARPAAAEQLLDTLTQYLRLSLPRLQRSESNLERETAVALAYMRLLDRVAGASLEFEGTVEPSAGDASFPPMVLQPLCDALARTALAAGKPAEIRLSASRDGDVARMKITARPLRTPLFTERLAEVRRTLATMFAPLDRLEIMMIPGDAVSILVEVPYVASPRADR
jgi:hypothetical protein